MILAWAAGLAAAEVPEGVRPVATDPGAPDRYLQHLRGSGQPEAALACDPLLPGTVLLCFRVWEDGKRRWVDAADLPKWDVTTGALRAHVTAAAEAQLEAAEWVPVAEMEARYLRHVDGDGWAVSGLLAPHALATRLGAESLRAAIPAQGVLLAWAPGSTDLEKVMAVGAREVFDGQSDRITPKVYQWDGTAWLPFGEAVPAPTP